mmetsp:Transcript_5354/g.11718  ORF Transcript_5354/g.11718 Transcript_5354/m.11718 type:complete len:1077 (-) Transcript_5354:655-3885(-)
MAYQPDDWERAVLITFNFTGAVDAALKERAAQFVDSIKKSPECWKLCIERFSGTPYPEVKFWCLQTLHEIVRTSYRNLPADARAMVKGTMMSWVHKDCNNAQNPMPVFLRNKLAQTLVSILQLEYPHDWPTFFQELIGALALGDGVVDMFCRILTAVDDDVISLEVPRSQDESKLSMHVKDSMREHSINDVAATWYQLVEGYHMKNPELTCMVLQTMARYIPWIDIGLVANEKFLALLMGLLDAPATSLRGAAAECLTEVISKRMDAVPKLNLIQSMNIVPQAAMWASGVSLWSHEDSELLSKFANLLAALAMEIMDSIKRLENNVISLTAMGFTVDDEAAGEVSSATAAANKLMEALFPAVLSAFKTCVDEVVLPLVPFMAAYVARLKTLHKRNVGLSAEAVQHIRAILEGLAGCSRYPQDSSCLHGGAPTSPVEAAAAREEQNEVEEKRRDLFTLFKNISKIAFTETLAFVGALLQRATSERAPGSEATFQEAELAVVLLYELGEGAPEEALKPDSGALGQLALALMQATLPAAQHRLVTLAVLETYVRYSRVMQQQQHVIPHVITTFLDGRGMAHPSEDVSTRACYLFCRLVKTLRANLRPFLGMLLQNLQPHLLRIVSTPADDSYAQQNGTHKVATPVTAVVDDRLYVFEAVGLLLGQDELPVQEQQTLLNALLQPLLEQIESNLRSPRPTSPGLILQALEAIVRLSKGFRPDMCTRTRPQLGQMFARCLEVAIQVPKVHPTHKLLRARFISCVHRLVECLSTGLLPFLPAALEVLISSEADPADLTEVLVLANQLIMKFKALMQPLVEGMLPVLMARMHAELGSGWDWSGKAALPGATATPAAAASPAGVAAGTSEDARERGELQRTFYALVHVMVHNGLSMALLKIPPAALDAIMSAVTRGASAHVDATVRRTCIQVLERLVNEWCVSAQPPPSSDPSAPPPPPQEAGSTTEVVPGFKRFAVEQLGAEACVVGLVRPPVFDLRDASTMSLLGEAAMALKLVYAKCGEEVVVHLVTVVLPALGFPEELQQQLVYHVRGGEPKELKDFLKALMLMQSRAQAGQAGMAGQAIK